MKIANHKIKELLDIEDPDHFEITETNDITLTCYDSNSLIPPIDNKVDDPVVVKCGYEGSDILHPINECFHCDYQRVLEDEEQRGVHWLDGTESWDYYDYWHSKNKKESI